MERHFGDTNTSQPTEEEREILTEQTYVLRVKDTVREANFPTSVPVLPTLAACMLVVAQHSPASRHSPVSRHTLLSAEES